MCGAGTAARKLLPTAAPSARDPPARASRWEGDLLLKLGGWRLSRAGEAGAGGEEGERGQGGSGAPPPHPRRRAEAAEPSSTSGARPGGPKDEKATLEKTPPSFTKRICCRGEARGKEGRSPSSCWVGWLSPSSAAPHPLFLNKTQAQGRGRSAARGRRHGQTY